MSKIICITNRQLFNNFHPNCNSDEDYLDHIRRITAIHPNAIILREKDLSDEDYLRLAEKVIPICENNGVQCILHNCVTAAVRLRHKAIHLPMPVLQSLTAEQRSFFTTLGASCHSLSEAVTAQQLGCTYITASHIFPTGCKRDIPAKGLTFLREICQNADIPVYALGGIHPSNMQIVLDTGAAGVCMMSEFMR